jgi:uncharacterized protein with PIN domain
MKRTKIIFSTEKEYDNNGKPWHCYSGSMFGKNNFYVKEYKDGILIITSNEKEAYMFTDDDICNECIEHIIKNMNPWTIALWVYENNKPISECVSYPNEYWQQGFMPSLMNQTIQEYEMKKYQR